MVKHAKHWPWSTAGYSEAPSWLNTHWLLAAFGKQQGKAMGQYRSFVSEGKNQPSPWESLQNQIYLGSESYVQKLQEKNRQRKRSQRNFEITKKAEAENTATIRKEGNQ